MIILFLYSVKIIKLFLYLTLIIIYIRNKATHGDWGLGDWGLGIGDWAQSPIPNPQSPIPNPQSPIPNIIFN
jgi:hypothetical protein